MQAGGKVTPEMQAAQDDIDFQRQEESSHKAILQQIVDFAVEARLHGIGGTTVEDAQRLSSKVLDNMRFAEMMGCDDSADKPEEAEFLSRWHAVILDKKNQKVDGAIVPVRFWYEDFMPLLLKCCSVSTRAQLDAIDFETEGELDAWYNKQMAAGVFDPYAADIRDKFTAAAFERKQSLKQAWNLSKHYLNGVQKRRERLEMGRESGYLSQYVAFIDIYVGRGDVEQAEMRVSFPYFIGPATWRLFHTSAEIANSYPEKEQGHIVKAIGLFVAKFATMYACPYCRYHFNRYVGQNREVDMYPLEYIFLGGLPKTDDMHRHIPSVLGMIKDAPFLRLFFWKLHNTVSSSIARSEPWFHMDTEGIYTSRYWPSLDSELDRTRSLGKGAIAIDRVQGIYTVTKVASKLSALLKEFHKAFETDDRAKVEEIYARAQPVIAQLDAAIIESQFLQRTYFFDSCCDDSSVSDAYGAYQEHFARSGHFIVA
jgi:hypothetical protein